MLTIATLVGEVRTHLCKSSVSNEQLLNEIVQPLLRLDGAHNRNGGPLYLDKSRTSRILSSKDDAPEALRTAAERVEIPRTLAREYEDFVGEYLDEDDFGSLKKSVIALCDHEKQRKALEALRQIDDDTALLLALSMLFAARADNRQKQELCLWKRGIASLSLVSGDIFARGFENRRQEKSIVVVCVDTLFQTHVTRSFEKAETPMVSEKTLHGQWIARMAQGGSDEHTIQKRINDSLRLGNAKNQESGESGYPIGTVVSIEEENAIYYLLAVSRFDEKGRAKATREDIAFAVERLFAFYDGHGQGYDIYLPLVGTGMSRAGLSPKESLDLIREAVQGTDIAGRVFVVAAQDALDALAS